MLKYAPLTSLLRFGLALSLLLPLAAQAQIGIYPNEACTIQVLNQTVKVRDDATWDLPDIPTNGGQVRVRLNCTDGYNTRAGQSGYIVVSPNRVNAVPQIVFTAPNPGPTQLSSSIDTSLLTEVGQQAQITVTGHFPGGATKDVTSSAQGTSYATTNPAVATLSPTGLVTAQKSGTVLVSIWNEGVVTTRPITVKAGADADEDGLPDDWEISVGLDPSEPLDALADNDKDNLNNLQEFAAGTSPFSADTDNDGISDGEELQAGNDGWITSPLLADTDGDQIPDAIELETGTDPTDGTDYDLGAALLGMEVLPKALKIVFNTVLGEASAQVKLTGILLDGTGLDLTGHPDVSWLSGDIKIASFGENAGQIFGGQAGETHITISVGPHQLLLPVEVTTFSPQALGFLDMPGKPNGMSVVGDHVYAACSNAGLQIVSLPPESALAIVGSLAFGDAAHDVRVNGDTAYVAAGSAGVQVVDVSNPKQPTLLGIADTPGFAWDLAHGGNWVIVADSDKGLALIDASEPANPTLVGTLSTPSSSKGVDIASEGNLAVVALGSTGVATINIAGDGTMSVAGVVSLGQDAREISYGGERAYVAIGNAGMAVVDISNPADPKLTSTIGPGLFMLNDVDSFGTLAFGADYYRVNSVPIVQVAVPDKPVFTDIVEFAQYSDDNGQGIAVDHQIVALAAGNRIFIGQYAGLEDNAGIPPTAVITQPDLQQIVVQGSKGLIKAEAFDDVFVDKVVFLLDGQVLGEDGSPPFTLPIDYDIALGAHGIGAEAYDLSGNVGVAEAVGIEVIEDPLTTVVGLVHDLDGNPVSDALVFFQNTNIAVETEADGSFSAPGVHTWEDIKVLAQGAVGDDILFDTFGPFSPVLGEVTDVGILVLETPVASTKAGPLVSHIVTFGAVSPAELENHTFGPIVSGQWTFQASNAIDAAGAMTHGPLVSNIWTFAAGGVDALGQVTHGPIVSNIWTFQATDTQSLDNGGTHGPVVSNIVTFAAGDNLTASSEQTLAPIVSAEITFSSQPVVAGVDPALADISNGAQVIVLTGLGFEDVIDLIVTLDGVEDDLITAGALDISPDGTSLTTTLLIDSAAEEGLRAVVPLTATGSSASHAGTGNTLELVP